MRRHDPNKFNGISIVKIDKYNGYEREKKNYKHTTLNAKKQLSTWTIYYYLL